MKQIFINVVLSIAILSCSYAHSSNPCFDLGHPEHRWHFVELPNGLSNVKWQASEYGISAVSFNSTEENINNWLKKCSIKLENEGALEKWFMVDSLDARALAVFKSKSTGKFCIQIEESQAPGAPENPKGFGDCRSELEDSSKKQL